MISQFSNEELAKRIKLIINRLGFVPKAKEDSSFLQQVPYWADILQEADDNYPGGFKGLLEKVAPVSQDYFQLEEVKVPSLEQRLAGVSIAQRGKVLELSKPGTRKTISALSAIIPIQKYFLNKYYPGQEKLKTFITCPGYVIPVWTREIEKLFKDPNVVVVTRENRRKAIERAAEPDANFVIVGYDMTFRNVSMNGNGNGSSGSFRETYWKYPDRISAFNRLGHFLNNEELEEIIKDNPTIYELHDIIRKEESKKEMVQVLEALKEFAFPGKIGYYAIVDEFHNIVGTDTKRAEAIAGIVKPARWAVLNSGSGIGNKLEDLAWAAHVTGFADNPGDFLGFINRDKAKKVRTFIDMNALHPARELRDVDPNVPKSTEETLYYDISDTEVELFSALVEEERFNGKDKYLLFRYLISNPRKLLPEGMNEDKQLAGKLREFFESNPGLEDKIRQINPNELSKVKFVRNIVEDIKRKGEKCIVGCEYQRDITYLLEGALEDLGVRRIDQDVSSDLSEVRLTTEQVETLRQESAKGNAGFRGDEKYMSDLSAKSKRILGIKPYKVYGMSDREIALQEFASDPDVCALVSTRTVLREGVELKEATHIISFEDTTVPHKESQFSARLIRSGQDKVVREVKLRNKVFGEVEDYFEGRRKVKENIIDSIKSEDISEKDMREWGQDSENDKLMSHFFKNISAQDLLAKHFSKMNNAGSAKYREHIQNANNALFVASLYNKNWEHGYSGNVAKLTRDIILGVEKRKGVNLERILDAASGPLTVSRMLSRPVLSIDMNRYQICYGIDACHNQDSNIGESFLGDITNLSRIVPVEKTQDIVFDPKQAYSETRAVEEKSKDLVVASLVFDLLDSEGRDNFLREANRVLIDGKYLMMVVPVEKIEEKCRADFLQDISKYGFAVSDYFTGTYQGKVERGNFGRKRIEAYVIVAEKVGSPEDSFQRLRLRPDSYVVNPEDDFNKIVKRRDRKEMFFSADYFEKIDGKKLDLRRVQPETIYSAGDIDKKIEDLSKRANPAELSQTIEDVKRIFGGLA